VFRAVDSNSGRSLALRVLPARSDVAREAFGTLLEDLRAAGRLTHPGLVRVLGMVEAEGRTHVISELIEGYDLETALAAGPMAASRVEALGRALTAAVAHVHERGLVHGSIRPSNVMLAGGAVRLADLGLGRLYAAIGPGSPYRAPERELAPAADVFSLGAVLFHALTGAPPDGQRPAPPGELGALLAGCLDTDPAARPSADELRARLGSSSPA
jgi:serine/threonine-protein kinase